MEKNRISGVLRNFFLPEINKRLLLRIIFLAVAVYVLFSVFQPSFISGSSMEPKISEGDTVIVRKQSDVESGKIAIVMVGGHEATCKKLVKHMGGVSLVPLNSAYPVLFFTNEEIMNNPVSVIGQVVELRAKL